MGIRGSKQSTGEWAPFAVLRKKPGPHSYTCHFQTRHHYGSRREDLTPSAGKKSASPRKESRYLLFPSPLCQMAAFQFSDWKWKKQIISVTCPRQSRRTFFFFTFARSFIWHNDRRMVTKLWLKSNVALLVWGRACRIQKWTGVLFDASRGNTALDTLHTRTPISRDAHAHSASTQKGAVQWGPPGTLLL